MDLVRTLATVVSLTASGPDTSSRAFVTMLGSTTAKNEDLDSCYGSGHAASWPATVTMRLYSANPMTGGVEIPTVNGYAGQAITNNTTNFPAASGGQKSNGVAVTFTATGSGWSAVATYWWFTDGSGNLLDGGPLTAPLIMSGPASVTFPIGSIVIAVQ